LSDAPKRTESRVSVPPSEPRPSRASFSALDAQIDRPARLQMIIALILGLVLVAIPLYLWRRPRAESIAVTPQEAGVEPPPAPPEEKVIVGESHLLSCHDPGTKKTPPNECDRLQDFEKAMAKAIEENASCVPRDQGGGTIVYVADVTIKPRRAMLLVTPKEGRTFKNTKVIAGCQMAVKNKLSAAPIEGEHQHTRYRISITATYPGSVK
jgi:hypothetical protein